MGSPLGLGAAHLQLVEVELLVAESCQIDRRLAAKWVSPRVSILLLLGHRDAGC